MSILIKGVQVVDGTGEEPYKADVFVDKNVISAIGDLKNKEADETIEGLGNYLTPGFIDVDTSSDHYLSLLTNPLQNDFSSQGVTTVIGGHCGSSLAPLLYGTLESIRKWVDITQVNVNWHTVGEFLEALGNFPLGVNFGTLVGHSTIRRSITGEVQRELSRAELEVFKKILSKGLSEGAFGFSTGLGYAHGRQTPYAELKDLVNIVKEYDAVYTTHLRSEGDGLLASIDETIKISKETGARTMISHFRPIIGYEDKFGEAVERLRSNYSAGNLYFYIYPFDTSLDALYTLLPMWAQEKNLEAMLENIKNLDTAFRIEREMKDLDFDNIVIADAPKHDYFVGKTVPQLSEMLGLPPVKSLLKVMEITKLHAVVFNKNINYDLLKNLFADPKVFIGSNGASRISSYKFLKHERASSTFSKYLEIVLQGGLMTLPAAIKRVTSFPAEYFGLKDRGVIKEGKIADLAILDKNDYKVKDVIIGGRATFGAPLKHSI